MHVKFLLQAWKSTLNPSAIARFQEREQELLLSPLTGKVTNPVQQIVSVYHSSSRDGKAWIETVNLLERSCSCGIYQQSHVPCKCAIFALKMVMRISVEEIFNSKKYFGPHQYTEVWRAYYADTDVFSFIPGDSEVQDFAAKQIALGHTRYFCVIVYILVLQF